MAGSSMNVRLKEGAGTSICQWAWLHHYLVTRNTWLAKLRETGAGWKARFTRIVASNEDIKRFLNIATILMSMVFS